MKIVEYLKIRNNDNPILLTSQQNKDVNYDMQRDCMWFTIRDESVK